MYRPVARLVIPAIAALSLGAGVTVKARTARLTIIACGVHAAYMASLRGWHAHALIAYAPPLPCLVSKPHGSGSCALISPRVRPPSSMATASAGPVRCRTPLVASTSAQYASTNSHTVTGRFAIDFAVRSYWAACNRSAVLRHNQWCLPLKEQPSCSQNMRRPFILHSL